MANEHHSYLRRLPPSAYHGHAYVHWTMTMQDRATGWLDNPLHASFREILLHTLSRHRLICPVYCAMPDHIHILCIGLHQDSDQRAAMKFFRRHFNTVLSSHSLKLQVQGFDNVLRQKDREKNAFVAASYYIAENPVRAKLVDSAPDWPYSGSLAVGYPAFDWRDDTFSEVLWKVVELERAKEPTGQ